MLKIKHLDRVLRYETWANRSFTHDSPRKTQMNPSNSEILAIVDKSGSMQDLQMDSIGGYNQFLKDQQALPGNCRVTTVLFNTGYETLDHSVPIASAKRLNPENYRPVGGTALFDTVCAVLSRERARIRQEGWARNVIVCILTDGQENQSRESTLQHVQAEFAQCQKDEWSLVFLASNQDAFSAATSYGINMRSARNFVGNMAGGAAGMSMGYSTMSASVGATRSGRSAKDFVVSPEMKKAMEQGGDCK